MRTPVILGLLVVSTALSVGIAAEPKVSPNGHVLVPGVGYGPIRFGQTIEQVKAIFGPADRASANYLHYDEGYVGIRFRKGRVNGIGCGFWCDDSKDKFEGRLGSGIRIGSSLADVIATHGEPDHPLRKGKDPTRGFHSMLYHEQGMGIFLKNGVVQRLSTLGTPKKELR